MRAANANLTPPQIIARMKASATPYPQPVTTPPTPVCQRINLIRRMRLHDNHLRRRHGECF